MEVIRYDFYITSTMWNMSKFHKYGTGGEKLGVTVDVLFGNYSIMVTFL